MTMGNHYIFRIRNWFRDGETNVLSLYNVAHFELTGWILQCVRESVFALTNSRQHKNKPNVFIHEVVTSIPDLHLIKSTSMTAEDYKNLFGSDKQFFITKFNHIGMLISDVGNIVLPPNDCIETKAKLHLSHEYFYISCIVNIPDVQVPLYFQTQHFDVTSLDFGSKTVDAPASVL